MQHIPFGLFSFLRLTKQVGVEDAGEIKRKMYSASLLTTLQAEDLSHTWCRFLHTTNAELYWVPNSAAFAKLIITIKGHCNFSPGRVLANVLAFLKFE